MKVAILLLAVVFSCQAFSNDFQEKWTEFQNKHGKTYKSPIELKKRMSIFSENLKKIESHNEQFEQGKTTWKMGVTKFADLTEQEFLDLISAKMEKPTEVSGKMFVASEVTDAPDAIDWREKNVVSEVKNQGSCGSCWSFSTTGALESLVSIHYDRSMSLSEQNLMDCVIQPNYTSFGCSGGLMTEAFKYVRDHGIETEQEYPYEMANGVCRQTRIVMQISDFVEVKADEESLRQAVGTVGPVSVGIEASGNFQLYTSGVFTSDTCTHNVNHGVLAVGYGNENGLDYWIVKNSWGADWGEQGFIKMARNRNNMCFIANMASYPVIY